MGRHSPMSKENDMRTIHSTNPYIQYKDALEQVSVLVKNLLANARTLYFSECNLDNSTKGTLTDSNGVAHDITIDTSIIKDNIIFTIKHDGAKSFDYTTTLTKDSCDGNYILDMLDKEELYKSR